MNETTRRVYLADPLWQRIQAHDFDEPGAEMPFSVKLSLEQNWSNFFTVRAIEEYRRFIYLCCINTNGASPSKVVDEVWHMHLTYTIDYWQRFCKITLERDVHHYPSAGGDTQKAKFDKLYDDTLELYEAVFGEQPPGDIWPAKSESPLPADLDYENIMAKEGKYTKYLLLLVPILAIGLLFNQVNPYRLTGPHFLFFYLLLAATTLLITYITTREKNVNLKEILAKLTPFTNRFELAYLAGGKDRFVLMCVCDLIQRGCLTHTENGNYILSESYKSAKDNPAVKYILPLERNEVYRLTQIERFLIIPCKRVADKYEPIKNAFETKKELYMLPIFTVLLGLARIFQGGYNDRPVGLLVVEMLFSGLLVALLIGDNNFFNSIRRVLKREEVSGSTVIDDSSLNIVFAGAYGLTGIIPFIL